jgi:pSer/pThr/pTyr-binding forkhead associated (FHA) protein
MNKIRLFYSYSHKDEAYREELEAHLKVLEREGILEGWHDRMIPAGTDWEGEIDENLEAADIILLMISANFIKSNYCFDKELKRAMERHAAKQAVVIPIIVRSVSYQKTPFAKLQFLPRGGIPVAKWDHPDDAWTDVIDGLRGVIETIRRRGRVVGVQEGVQRRHVIVGFKLFTYEIHCLFRRSIILGRSPECHIPLLQAPRDVSHSHAQVEHQRVRGDFEIRDLDSTNGLYVNGRRVEGAQPLRSGDEVRLGKTLRFLFEHHPGGPDSCGVLAYMSEGGKELARYVIAPGDEVRLGNGPGLVARVPMLDAGQSLGAIQRRPEGLYFIAEGDAEDDRQSYQLEDNLQIDLHRYTLRISLP